MAYTFDVTANTVLVAQGKINWQLDVAVMDGVTKKTTLKIDVSVPMHIDDPRLKLRELIAMQVQEKYTQWKRQATLQAQSTAFINNNLEPYLNTNIKQ